MRSKWPLTRHAVFRHYSNHIRQRGFPKKSSKTFVSQELSQLNIKRSGWGIRVVIEGGEFKGQTTDIPRHDLQNTNNPYDPTNKEDPFGALDGCTAPTPTQ